MNQFSWIAVNVFPLNISLQRSLNEGESWEEREAFRSSWKHPSPGLSIPHLLAPTLFKGTPLEPRSPAAAQWLTSKLLPFPPLLQLKQNLKNFNCSHLASFYDSYSTKVCKSKSPKIGVEEVCAQPSPLGLFPADQDSLFPLPKTSPPWSPVPPLPTPGPC